MTTPSPNLAWLTRWPGLYCSCAPKFEARRGGTAAHLPQVVMRRWALRAWVPPVVRCLGRSSRKREGSADIALAPGGAAEGVQQIEAVFGAGDAHVGQPPFLFHVVGVFEGAAVGQQAFFQADDEDHAEFEAFGRVQGEQGGRQRCRLRNRPHH